MWLRIVWISEVVTVDPFVILEELIRHQGDVCFHCGWISGFDSFKVFIEDDMVLRADELCARVENESHVTSMMLRLADVDAHVASCSRELLHGFAILQFLDEYENWATKDMKVIWIYVVFFVCEKFVRTFRMTSSWRVVMYASCVSDGVGPELG
jgi:hypothetical protein